MVKYEISIFFNVFRNALEQIRKEATHVHVLSRNVDDISAEREQTVSEYQFVIFKPYIASLNNADC